MACHVLVMGAGSGVLCWVADEGAVLVALGVLEGARWLGDGAWADVSRALSRGVAFWGAHGTLNTGDGDVDFTGLASSWLERILEVAFCLAVALKNKTRSVRWMERERKREDREKLEKTEKNDKRKKMNRTERKKNNNVRLEELGWDGEVSNHVDLDGGGGSGNEGHGGSGNNLKHFVFGFSGERVKS